ncbi:MAG: PhoH family protein [Myxococcota bacterium]|nr:PhoH family protein [Myxococcota bacterium]
MTEALPIKRKIYVLDTNVLLHDPTALFKFEDNEVVIPLVVIEEVDTFKRDQNERGRNARQFSRYLDQLRAFNNLQQGVELEDGGLLRVDMTSHNLVEFHSINGQKADNQILSVALSIARGGDVRVTLVSKDTNMRIKADAMGLRAEDYEHGKVQIDELYGGQEEMTVPRTVIEDIYRAGEVEVDTGSLPANSCLVLRNEENASNTALARVKPERGAVSVMPRFKEGIWGIFPRNKEQTFAFDLLMDDDIKLVTLVGKAGTGKTLLAIAAGLQKTADEAVYQRLLVSRPVFPLGRDIGFLPGDIEEKLNPWMKPVYDNVELILDLSREKVRDKKRGYQELIDLGLLEIEPLTYIRGRSIPHQFLLIDEAQNLTPHEIKTIITRAGEGTKIVMTGDPHQIDNPYVDSTSNGLTFVVHKFQGEPLAGHITLVKGERSELAERAAELL